MIGKAQGLDACKGVGLPTHRIGHSDRQAIGGRGKGICGMITRENRNIVTFTAVDSVIAGTAYDGVIASATINDIITKTIGERIGTIATKHRNGDIPYNLYVVDVI